MSDSSNNSSPRIHCMSRKSDFPPRMSQELNFISSIWEDDYIEKLANNQWKCLWCDNTFLGFKNCLSSISFTWNKRYAYKVLFFRNWKIIYQDTNIFVITNILIIMLSAITPKSWIHQYHVYRIRPQKSSVITSIVTPELGLFPI